MIARDVSTFLRWAGVLVTRLRPGAPMPDLPLAWQRAQRTIAARLALGAVREGLTAGSRRGDALYQMQVPTLVIAGAADGLLPHNLLDFQRLPNATLHVFSRVAHSVPSDVPEEFSEVVADFMEHGVVNNQTQLQKLEDAKVARI